MRLLKYTEAKRIGKFSCQLSFYIYLQLLTEHTGTLFWAWCPVNINVTAGGVRAGAKPESNSLLSEIEPKTLGQNELLIPAILTQTLNMYLKSFWGTKKYISVFSEAKWCSSSNTIHRETWCEEHITTSTNTIQTQREKNKPEGNSQRPFLMLVLR